MKRRFLSMLLASLMILTSIPVQTCAAEGKYSASLSGDLQQEYLILGDTVTVSVMVTGQNTAVNTYNAYDLKLSYDTRYLTLTSFAAADSDAEYTDSDGRIRVKGYGESKSFSTAAVTLTFQAVCSGTADVSLLHAKIDNSDSAGLRDAPEAKLTQKNLAFTVEGQKVVLEGEGIGVTSNVATSREDFLFWLIDYKNYDYTLKVMINGVDVTEKVTYNEETGEYTIPEDLITGKIEITAERTPKTYKVTIKGNDVVGEKTAQYNTDYSFLIQRIEDYLYTVAIKIGEKEYTDYDVWNDYYVIPGTDITGDISITVTKELDYSDKVTVTFAGAGAKDGSGQKLTKLSVEYPFKIKRKKGYTYSVTVYVNGRRVPYDYDYELDTYYILPDKVTGNIVIVIGKVATLEVTEYVALDQQSLFLLVYNGAVGEGQVPKYDGHSMYWSEQYNAYVWLVLSEDSDKKVKKTAEGKITLNEGTAAGSIDYSGNVNRTLQTDLADVELLWEIYEGKHSLAFMEMQQLLSADVYPDRKVNVRDVAAVLHAIS